jgi:hypothetical protein
VDITERMEQGDIETLLLARDTLQVECLDYSEGDFEMSKVRTKQEIRIADSALFQDLAAYEQCYKSFVAACQQLIKSFGTGTITAQEHDQYAPELQALRTEVQAPNIPLESVSDLSRRANEIRCEVMKLENAFLNKQRGF